jgi:hypothetical protein
MTDFDDEKILELRKQKERSKPISLEDGVFIGEEYYEFEAVEIFPKLVSVSLPTAFINMPPNLAKLKYPSEMRPQVIKTSLDTKVNFMFNYYSLPLENHQVNGAADDFRQALKRVNPSMQFFSFQDLELGKNILTWFDFKSNTLDSQLYNMVFCTPISKNIFQGFFNCVYTDAIDWAPVMLQILLTIQDLSNR